MRVAEKEIAPVSVPVVLARVRFFSGLSAAQLESVAALARVARFPQDTRIYNRGDDTDDSYVLADDVVRFRESRQPGDAASSTNCGPRIPHRLRIRP